MELNERKYIQNTGDLPGYDDGKPGFFKRIGDAFKKDGAIGKTFSEGGFLGKDGFMDEHGAAIGTAATGVLDMVNGIGAASKYNKTADDLLQDAGKSQSNIGGVGYTVQNDINKSAEEAQVDAEAKSSTLGLATKGAATGAAIASVIPGVGTAVGGIVGGVAGLVGGLFGGGAKKREMKKQLRLAEIKRINQNDFNRSGALTTVLQNDLAQNEGNQESQVLYAANGKALGGQKQNAWGSNGEHKIEVDASGNVISDERLGTGVDNKDTVPIHVNPNTIILPNKKVKLPGGQEIIPSRYYEQTGDLQGAEYATRMNIQNKKYKNGKLPGFKWGLPEWVNFAGNAYGYLTADSEKRKIDAEEISKPDTYQANPNAAKGLYILGQQQENPYAIIPELYNEYAKGMYAISNAGGLSGGQRALARLSALNNLTAQSAKLQQAAQAANIAHRQTYADAMLRYGAADAQNRMAALQYDYNAYNQAHGAKRAMSSELLGKKVGYGLNFAKGVSDLFMWRNMKEMWDKDYEADHPETDSNNKSTNAPKLQIDPSNLFGRRNFNGYSVPKLVDPSSSYYTRLGDYGKKMAAEENDKIISKEFPTLSKNISLALNSQIGKPWWNNKKEWKLSTTGLPGVMMYNYPLDLNISKLRRK